MQLGTEERPLRVAVVGSGPSGFYAAEALLKQEVVVTVDLFERLPVPFGLVRYGVAPDHAKIKNVTRVYDRTALHERFRFLGNVDVGKDISIKELQSYYDAIILTVGAQTDRQLGIPGEDLKHSYTATEFVAWYNGHPDYVDHDFHLDADRAVIIGQGNVAIDVARILAKTVEELKTTDIASHALATLAKSTIKDIYLVGRRGPAQAAFTVAEIKEMGELEDCDIVIDPADLDLNPASAAELDMPGFENNKKNVDVLRRLAETPSKNASRRLHILFFKSPKELLGTDKLERLILEQNELTGEAGRQKASGTGNTSELEADILFRSVGYRGVPIEGVPFYDPWGTIPNKAGQVTDNDGNPVPGMFTAGWIKRGPSGVIGTNKQCAVETVATLMGSLADLPACSTPDTQALMTLLAERQIRVVGYDDWQKIDAAEQTHGSQIGKPREKLVRVEDMLAVLDA
jgi:ferredoxin--NADP+ reductase